MQRQNFQKSIGGILPNRNNLWNLDSDAKSTIVLEGIANKVGDILEKYYNQDFVYLLTNLDEAAVFYQDLIRTIYYMVIPSYISFNIRQFFFQIVDGVKQSTQNAKHCETIKYENDELKEKTKVMDDYNLLKDYLDNMYENLIRTKTIYDFKPISAIIPQINPKYMKYYELYGPPVNGVYKAELLENVERILGIR